MRLNQYLARCGVCSRRAADNIINEGRVVVDGMTASLGIVVDENSEVYVDGKKISLPSDRLVLAYYKPVGVTCTEKDPHAKRIVTDEIIADRRVTYAGRLDKDSEGLLLLTDDGELINSMMRGSNAHEKEYEVIVNRPIDDDFIKKMSSGVYLKDLDTTTRPCVVRKTSNNSFNIVLTQGLNRQIRRMCENFGLKVTKLKRTRVMNITLRDLQVGASRKLTDEELSELCLLLGLHK